MKVLVTGAAKGLGRALTEQLLEAGHEVVAVDLETDSLDPLAISSRGACRIKMTDMGNPDSVARLLRYLAKDTFDQVFLNAGISATGRFEEIPGAAYQKLIEVNLVAPLVIASSMVRNDNCAAKSRIVFISSLSHAVGYPGASVYAATKDALAVYARSIRKPFRKKGVRITTIFPGPLKTEHAERHAPKGAKASKRMEPELAAKTILKAVRSGKRELYLGKGAGLARFGGALMPNLMTRFMRRMIFDKLDENQY